MIGSRFYIGTCTFVVLVCMMFLSCSKSSVNTQPEKTLSITYDGNGNTGGTTPIDTKKYIKGDTAIVLDNSSNLVKTDFTFSGWNTKADGSGITYESNEKVIIKASITLYALWTETTMSLVVKVDSINGLDVTLPLHGRVDVMVDWGDSKKDIFKTHGNHTHKYVSGGEYIIKILGKVEQFGYEENEVGYPNATKIIKVLSFGSLGITSLHGAFFDAKNLVNVPNVLPNTVIDLSCSFALTEKFNQDISVWNTEKVNNMSKMFWGAAGFNQNIGKWDVSNVLHMNDMFSDNRIFNQDIGKWNTEKVINMRRMFARARSFNQDISKWNTSSVENMYEMFWGAIEFNQDISTWDTRNVRKMGYMFNGALSFNQNISKWNTSNVIEMEAMFWAATSFNQNIEKWDVSNVINMSEIFREAINFNQDLSEWDVSSVVYHNNFDQKATAWEDKNKPKFTK